MNQDDDSERIQENEQEEKTVNQTEDNHAEEGDGDDESKEQNKEDEPRSRRRTKRNVRVEEGDEEEVKPARTHRVNRQSSSEDEVARSSRSRRKPSGSESTTRTGRRRVSSSEDEVSSSRRKGSLARTKVSDRKASFEQPEATARTKRDSFSTRANTVSTTNHVESRRDSYKSRTMSVESDKLNRKQSVEGRPEWSSSTIVEHGRVDKNTLIRRESTTHSESDESKSVSQLHSRWEGRRPSESRDPIKTRAIGGTTGAAALKAKFESPRSGYQRQKSLTTTERNRTMSTDSEDGTYKKVSALSMKARFEAKNTEATSTTGPVRRNFVINKNRVGGAAKKFNVGAPTSNKCSVCNKTVYPLEKLEADGKMYHKFCFKCTTCKRTVGLGNYAALQGKIYCKPHLKQLFKLKGNYDEGFGREQRKADWLKKDGSSDSTAQQQTPVENGHANQEIVVNETDENED